MKEEGKIIPFKYQWMLSNLIKLVKVLSLQYIRSKVRNALPESFSFIIDELLHRVASEEDNQAKYHKMILETIINLNNGDEFIIELAGLIKRLIVARLHIVGDIFELEIKY